MFVQGIASEVQSETKWKQLGELAMSTGKVLISFRINLSLSEQSIRNLHQLLFPTFQI